MKYPLTPDEAKRMVYGRDDNWHEPTPYNPTRCAYRVSEPPWYFDSHQCKRRPGYGPGELFCSQHAKIICWYIQRKDD